MKILCEVELQRGVSVPHSLECIPAAAPVTPYTVVPSVRILNVYVFVETMLKSEKHVLREEEEIVIAVDCDHVGVFQDASETSPSLVLIFVLSSAREIEIPIKIRIDVRQILWIFIGTPFCFFGR